MSERTYWFSVFLAGLLFGVCLVSFISFQNGWHITSSPAKEPGIADAPQNESDSTLHDASGTVAVQKQSAGDSVLVDVVAVAPPGVWVAVHELSSTGLANALGAARVRTASENVVVPLLRGTVPRSAYAIVLYRDDGDDVFTLGKDSIYVDFDTGERVIASFTTK
jgi:hypothetical protein